MTRIKKLAQFLGLGLATMGLVACGGGGGSSGGGTGLMSLAVTDAPIDGADKVVVRFTHVELQPADGGERVVIYFNEPALTEEPDTDDTVGEKVETLVEESSDESVNEPTGVVREIDLLTLHGENYEPLFEEVEVPAGDYAWIRFYLEPEPGPSSPPLSNFLTSSYIEFEDSTRANLIIPGGLQAGLQLVSGFTVPEGGSVSFTVDFDLRNMIRPDNRFEGYYRMRRALRLVDNSEVGVISGAIDVLSYPDLAERVATSCTQDGDRCPGVSVFVYSATPVEENSDLEQDTGSEEGGNATVEIVSVEEPLTSADVFAKDLDGHWGYRYTVGFLSPGSYDLKLTLDGDPLDEADAVQVDAGKKTIVDFPVPNQ